MTEWVLLSLRDECFGFGRQRRNHHALSNHVTALFDDLLSINFEKHKSKVFRSSKISYLPVISQSRSKRENETFNRHILCSLIVCVGGTSVQRVWWLQSKLNWNKPNSPNKPKLRSPRNCQLYIRKQWRWRIQIRVSVKCLVLPNANDETIKKQKIKRKNVAQQKSIKTCFFVQVRIDRWANPHWRGIVQRQ